MKTELFYIEGRWTGSVDTHAGTQELLNPATSECVACTALGSRADAMAAITAARRAFDTTGWQHAHRDRAAVLLRFADRLEAQRERVADLLVELNGKLRREAMGETMAAISELRYYAGLARNLFGRTLEVLPGRFSSLDREAVGVAVIIVPWNAPVTLLVRSLAPAIAAGCTSIIKSAEQTMPVHNLVLQCLVDDASLPAGAINSLTGPDVSPVLCESPDVDVISFTGSTRVGKRIAETASRTLTRMSLELGGKAPAIVYPDCNIEVHAQAIAAGAMIMAGQQCTALARVIVHETIYEKFKDTLAGILKAWRVDFGHVTNAQMGCLIDIANRDRVAAWIERGERSERLIVRGEIPDGKLKQGAFLRPSLVEVEDLNSPFIQEEIFGPLLVIERFSNDEEAVCRANATRYGLGASVWTADWARGKRIARQIRSGTVWLNTHNQLFAESETGGFRESGIGKLHGVEAMNDFMTTKHFYYEIDAPAA
jgi:betaine-aldehyde dehydrogenase